MPIFDANILLVTIFVKFCHFKAQSLQQECFMPLAPQWPV